MALTKVKSGVADADILKIINSASGLVAAPAADDLLPIYDTSGSAGKKITIEELYKAINNLTGLGANADTADLIPLYDSSGSVVRKVTVAQALSGVNTLTSLSSADKTNDLVVVYDTSAGTVKKVAPTGLSAFTREFVSSEQVITTGGSLTIPHGLAVKPKLISLTLNCRIAQLGYSINDELFIGLPDHTTGRGVAIVADATNLNCRYGNAANAFAVLNKTTGALNAITNANWTLTISAWV